MPYWHIDRHINQFVGQITAECRPMYRLTLGRYCWPIRVTVDSPHICSRLLTATQWLMCWQVIDQDINRVVTNSGYHRSKGVDQHVNGVSTNSWPTVDQYVDLVTVDSFTKRYLKYTWSSCNIIVYCNWWCRSSWSLETVWTMDWTLGSIVRLNQSRRKS